MLSLFLPALTAWAQSDPRFAALDQQIASGQLGPINSLLIQHGDVLLHESYYHGANAADLQHLFSVTKSVGATLIGMAERRGLLSSSDSALPDLLPAYNWSLPPISQHAELSLHDVLTMRHGLEWDEWSSPFFHPANSYQQMLHSADWYRFTLSRPRVAPPDSGFTYSTGNSTLMSGVLREVSSLSPGQVFVEWLAQPLGIENHDWEVITGVDGSHTRDFPFGDVPMGVGLKLRPRDLLRIGELYLNRGVYGGRRLLDAHWIERAWTAYSHAGNEPYFHRGPEQGGYGYQWWFNEFVDASGRRIGCWYAAGSSRQYLFVCPSLQLIVTSTSLISDYDGPGIGQAMRQHILPRFELQERVAPQISGLWYDPATSGQGFNLQVAPGGLFGFYYGYDGGQPLWLLLDVLPVEVEFGETMTLDAFMPNEGVFGAPVRPADGGIAPWGTLTLRFDACTRAFARLEGLSGTQEFDLVLLAGIDGYVPDCTAPGAPRPMADATGTWYEPATSGQGWNLIQTPGGLVGFFYGYDQDGGPLWLLTRQVVDIEPGKAQTFDLLAGQGGSFTDPVPPADLEHWGTIELVLEDCRNGTADVAGRDGQQVQQLAKLANVRGVSPCDEAGTVNYGFLRGFRLRE